MKFPVPSARVVTARSAVRRRLFAIVFVLVVINLIDRTTVSVAMPTIGKEFAAPPTIAPVFPVGAKLRPLSLSPEQRGGQPVQHLFGNF